MSQSLALVLARSQEGIDQFNQGELQIVNSLLDANRIPQHTEPTNIDRENICLPSMNWYAVDYVRFLAAKFLENPHWIPDKKLCRTSKIPPGLRSILYQEGISHLVCDMSCTVFYIPVPFDKVIHRSRLGSICSSISLQEEVLEIAEKLNFDLGEYVPDVHHLLEMREPELQSDFLKPHKLSLLCLYNMTIASIRYGSALVIN